MMSTKKLYDIDAYETEFEARVISCEKVEAGNSCDDAKEIYGVVLEQTLFFPEEGGQTPDKGSIDGKEVINHLDDFDPNNKMGYVSIQGRFEPTQLK